MSDVFNEIPVPPAATYESWHSYPSLYAIGHRVLGELLLDPVIVQEKVDGSQFSFGVFIDSDGNPDLKMRSKGAQLNIHAPDAMFRAGVNYVKSIEHLLTPGWTYRGEYLNKPKHNALAYDRIPKNHIAIFDINTGHEHYMPSAAVAVEAERIGLEAVPTFYQGRIEGPQAFRNLLDRVSFLGGQKIEGVVVKNYNRFGPDKKALMGKFVSEAFKEVHQREWKASNPTKLDVVAALVESLKTPARWNKAIQHLREAGKLTDSPRDIGLLIPEVRADILKEELEFIADKLVDWAMPTIMRGVVAGLPEFYKEVLLRKQFENDKE